MFTRHINFCEVHKSAWMANGGRKKREQDFPKNKSWFFEFHRTSDTHMCTLALSNRAYCLYKLFFNQGSV